MTIDKLEKDKDFIVTIQGINYNLTKTPLPQPIFEIVINNREIVNKYNQDNNLKLIVDYFPIKLKDQVLRKRTNKIPEWILTNVNKTYLKLIKQFPADYIKVTS